MTMQQSAPDISPRVASTISPKAAPEPVSTPDATRPSDSHTGNDGFRKTVDAVGRDHHNARFTSPHPQKNTHAQIRQLTQEPSDTGREPQRTESITLPASSSTAGPTAPADHHPACSTPVTQRVVDGLTHGQTPRMVANKLGLPLDFVDLVIERERTAGRLNVYDLRSCNSTTGEGCDPDPESLVCAGCPILPAAIRRRQSVFGSLKAKLRE